MTQDEIIEMAVLAGLEQDGEMWFSNTYKTEMDVHISHLQAFAKLVAVAAASKEREAVEERVVDLFTDMETPYLPDIVKAIRAGSEA